jgi:putative transposase
MIRAHLIRLNPTPEQADYFRKACGTARFVFNWALARWKDYRAQGRQVSMHELKQEFNHLKRDRFPWVYNVTKCAAEQEFTNLGQALANYFRKKKAGTLPKLKRRRKDGEQGGFPHFKSGKGGYGSFYLANDKFSVDGHIVQIPKLGRVNMTEPLRLAGKIVSATVSYRAGWWWIAITVEMPTQVAQSKPLGAVGVDVGLKALAVVSSGEVIENQKHLVRRLRRIKRLQRALNRKQSGSQNRARAVVRLSKAHFKVACGRKDVAHKLTSRLVQQAAIIGMEDLHVSGLLKNHRLARAISDAAWAEVGRQLSYKAAAAGSQVMWVDRFFPSSQVHHGCGGRKADLSLKERSWRCPVCGQEVNRDLNTALNIRDEAVRLITASAVVATSRTEKIACGRRVRPAAAGGGG